MYINIQLHLSYNIISIFKLYLKKENPFYSKFNYIQIMLYQIVLKALSLRERSMKGKLIIFATRLIALLINLIIRKII